MRCQTCQDTGKVGPLPIPCGDCWRGAAPRYSSVVAFPLSRPAPPAYVDGDDPGDMA